MFQTRKPPRQKAKISGKSLAIPLILVIMLAIMLAAYFFMYTQGKAYDAAIDLQTSLINQSMQTSADTQEIESKITQYKTYEASLEETQAVLSAIPEFDRQIFDTIDSARPTNVTINGVSVSDNVVSIFCTTSSNIPPAGYAEALDSLPEFETVGYTGFQESGEGLYSFTLTCVLPLGNGGDMP